jgi:hypothetical protein
MVDADTKFPPGLTDEEKSALQWKIERDYELSNFGAISYKNEYVTFAINFYTRNIYSLEDVVVQYRAHKVAERTRKRAHDFMTDMLSRAREQASVLALLE